MDRTKKFRNTCNYRLQRRKWNGERWWEKYETEVEALTAADTHGGRPERFDRKTGRWLFMRRNEERTSLHA
jgi:hypothetical protein